MRVTTRVIQGEKEIGEPLYFEDWAASYGSPYLIDEETVVAGAELVEEGDGFIRDAAPGPERRTAFIDGVRRGEGILYRPTSNGALASGLVGAHGCGAALWTPGEGVVFGPMHTRRMVIIGCGLHVVLPAVDGYRWESVSLDSSEPDRPLQELQRRMREAEGRLAESLAGDGWLAVLDGPLNFIRSRGLPVIGYVKTHHRALLALELHARVGELGPAQRTALFSLGEDRYSCYLRIAEPQRLSGPWYGVVRIEIPQSFGLEQAGHSADEAARVLPRFAGVAHRDPRAPQNLQPIGMLEERLRHRLGMSGLASRAVRQAVAHVLADAA